MIVRLRASFEPDANMAVMQIDLYNMYVHWTTTNSAAPVPIMEFMRMVLMAFPGKIKTATKIGPDGQPKFALQGLRLRNQTNRSASDATTAKEVAQLKGKDDFKDSRDSNAEDSADMMDTDDRAGEGSTSQEEDEMSANEEKHNGPTAAGRCKWRGCTVDIPASASDEELLDHILIYHFKQGQKSFSCCWLHCKKFEHGIPSRAAALSHFRLHTPRLFKSKNVADADGKGTTISTTVPRVPGVPSPASQLYPQPIVAPKEVIGASSVPLTAALVLRNLARSPDNRDIFVPFEADLAYAMSVQAANEGMAKVLASLLAELGKVPKLGN